MGSLQDSRFQIGWLMEEAALSRLVDRLWAGAKFMGACVTFEECTTCGTGVPPSVPPCSELKRGGNVRTTGRNSWTPRIRNWIHTVTSRRRLVRKQRLWMVVDRLSLFAYKYSCEGLVFTQPLVIYRKHEGPSSCLLVCRVCDILWCEIPSEFTHNVPMYQDTREEGSGSVDRTRTR